MAQTKNLEPDRGRKGPRRCEPGHGFNLPVGSNIGRDLAECQQGDDHQQRDPAHDPLPGKPGSSLADSR